MVIREYQNTDELGWVRCRVLSFLDSAYFDHVLRKKEDYEHVAIELVAEIDGSIVGILDIEYEDRLGSVCYLEGQLGGVIWHLGVLPEYRNQGISSKLLARAIEILKEKNVKRIEAWTRDDAWVIDWYLKRGFEWKEKYLHVYGEGEECLQMVEEKEKFFIVNSYAHYVGDEMEKVKESFKRVHECNLFELSCIDDYQ